MDSRDRAAGNLHAIVRSAGRSITTYDISSRAFFEIDVVFVSRAASVIIATATVPRATAAGKIDAFAIHRERVAGHLGTRRIAVPGGKKFIYVIPVCYRQRVVGA